MKRIGVAMSCLIIGLPMVRSASGGEPGFVEDFPAAGGIAGFMPEFILDNPATGGVGGDGDGYLRVTRESAGNLGTSTSRAVFTGNLVADGVTGFGVYLNDVGDFDDVEIHIGVGTRFTNFWLYTEGFHPPHDEWAYFEVDLTDPNKWTQTQGSGGDFLEAIAGSERLLMRHDLPPLVWDPDPEAGDFGIDRITVLPTAGCTRDPQWQCDGDVDGDGQVNPVDSGLVQAAFGSTDEQDLCNYDVDCDEQINPVDSGIVQSLFGTCETPRNVCP